MYNRRKVHINASGSDKLGIALEIFLVDAELEVEFPSSILTCVILD